MVAKGAHQKKGFRIVARGAHRKERAVDGDQGSTPAQIINTKKERGK